MGPVFIAKMKEILKLVESKFFYQSSCGDEKWVADVGSNLQLSINRLAADIDWLRIFLTRL